MASVNEVIDIQITRETRGVSRENFGTQMFLGLHAHFPERVRLYQRSQFDSGSISDEIGSESDEYQAISIAFSQNPSSNFIKIGRQKADTVDFTVDVANNSTYTLTVDGTEVSVTSDADATDIEIVGLLDAEFTSAGAPGTFTDNTDGTFTITPADPDDFYVRYTSNLNPTYNTSESITDAVTACRDYDDDWFFLTAYTHTSADIQSLAAYAEARSIIYGAAYDGADALDAQDTTDPGSVLKALSYSNTFILYNTNLQLFPEVGIVSRMGSTDPGSSTWNNKEIVGALPDTLTTTQSFTLRGPLEDDSQGKGYNTYEPMGGRNVFRDGQMVNGEFTDTIRFAYWLEARMKEEIFLLLVNSEKVPYTKSGFAQIEGQMRKILQQGVAVGGLVTYNINTPNPRSLPSNSRINRIAEGFTFTGLLASAVHAVEIRGNLTL